MVGFAIVYFAVAKLSLGFASLNASASPVWPPTGLAIAVLVLAGYRLAPGVFLGAFAANLLTQGTGWTSAAIAGGNTLEALLGAYAVNAWCGGTRVFQRPANVFRFAVLAAAGASLVSATIGTATLYLAGLAGPQVHLVWYTWWLGDAAGALLVVPPILLWTRRFRPASATTDLRGFVLATALLVGVGIFVFSGRFDSPINTLPLAFLLLPAIVYISYSYTAREASTATLGVAAIAIWGTLEGSGPFAGSGANTALLQLQAFLGVVSLTGLFLAVVVTERRGMEEVLRRANATLGVRVDGTDTTLEAALAELRHAEEILRQAERVAQIGSWEWDIRTDRVSWSDGLYRLFAREPTGFQPTYAGYLEALPPKERSRVDGLVRAAMKSHSQFGFEHVVERPDGEERIIQARGVVHRDVGGTPYRLTGTAQDVTDSRRAAQELEAARRDRLQAEKMASLGSLVAGVAHEIRTPLTYARTVASLLEQRLRAGSTLDPDAQRYLETLTRGLGRIDGIVGQLRQYARPAPSPKEVGLHEVLGEAAAVFRTTRGAQYQIEAQLRSTPLLPLDAGQIQQVAINLLNNAADAMPQGGVIRIETRQDERQVEFEVSDTGPGIPPEVQARLFDPFFTTKPDGVGLGLAISRRIVEAHRGTIEWATEAGRGSRFRVAFPLKGGGAA